LSVTIPEDTRLSHKNPLYLCMLMLDIRSKIRHNTIYNQCKGIEIVRYISQTMKRICMMEIAMFWWKEWKQDLNNWLCSCTGRVNIKKCKFSPKLMHTLNKTLIKCPANVLTFLLVCDSCSGDFVWHFHIYICYTLVCFIPSILLPLPSLPFLKWLWQVSMIHIYTYVESAPTIFTILHCFHLPSPSC
jgi:hypothetical protein